MGTEKKTLLKNFTSIGIIQIANYAFPMITIPIVSRIIGPDKLGVINFSAAFIAYFTLLIGFGFNLTATRRVASDPNNINNRNTVFSEVFTSQCLLLLTSTILFVILLFAIPQLENEKRVAIYTFFICLSTLMTQDWLFQAMQDLSKIAVLNLVSKILYTLVILMVIQKKSDYIWQPLVLSLSQVLISLICFFWAINRYQLKLYKVEIRECLKLMMNERVVFFSLCIINIYTITNVVILGIFQDSIQVGYFSSAQKLIQIALSIISIPLTQALFPYIGNAFGKSYEKGIEIAQKLVPLVFIITFFVGIVIFIGAPTLVMFFYGRQFLPAIVVCRILAFIPMIISLATICGIHVMLNLKMDKVFLRATAIGAVFSIVLNILLVKRLGYIGSAFTWILTEALTLVLLFVLLKKKGISLINWDYFKIPFYKTNFNVLKKSIFSNSRFNK